MNNVKHKPIILTILDGWGHSTIQAGNAIHLAKTPTMDMLLQKYPKTFLNASGEDVGLPNNQMGNSEVGHTTIGAGRIINQDLVKISKSIKNKDFFSNPTINKVYNHSNQYQSKLHLIGLCSNGGVHSHISHLKALIDISSKYNTLTTCLHLILDGRDTDAKKAKIFIKEITDYTKNFTNINICTISGRYYSMDRDCRWSRTEKTYKSLINDSLNNQKMDILDLIDQYYKKNISDEFIPPTRVNNGKITDNDSIIFFNFRPDRIRQLLHTFAKPNFKGFKIKSIKNLMISTLTEYDSTIPIPVIFPPTIQNNFLGQVISNLGFKQLRLAETEKYAHVTYFFNGGIEEPFPGEDRILIPSPKVDTYDLSPEMSAYELTTNLINEIKTNKYDLIVVNYANPDMVGHTGNLNATIEAIEIVDKCINKVFTTIFNTNYTLIITADHGNADCMLTNDTKVCKSHSLNPVPFIVVNPHVTKQKKLKNFGSLADIAPTILDLLNIKIPKEMNGCSLLIENQIKQQNNEY